MPNLVGAPALAASGDGRVELFVFTIDGHLWHIWQPAWSNGWSGWAPAGTTWASPKSPAALAPSGDGRLELFVAAADLQHAWQTAWSNGWSAWISHGSPTGRGFLPPGLAQNADGRLMLFVADGELWRLEQIAWSYGWSGWEPHGAPSGNVPVDGPVTPARSGNGRIEVFVIDEKGALWNVSQTAPAGPWSGWRSMGAPDSGLDGRPAVARSADGRMELFVRGVNDELWHRWPATVGPRGRQRDPPAAGSWQHRRSTRAAMDD
jgi:hypothetical protein